MVPSGWFFPCRSDVRILLSVAAWKSGGIPFLVHRPFQILMGRCINPLMETRKKKHKAYTATCTFSICRSVEVTIH